LSFGGRINDPTLEKFTFTKYGTGPRPTQGWGGPVKGEEEEEEKEKNLKNTNNSGIQIAG
jgi:hypothetical protein